MAHTARPMIAVLEEISARLVTVEAAIVAMQASIDAQASDLDAIAQDVSTANEIARYMAEHTYGADPALP